ncbi:hypothetical protein E2C01_079156 [Portunus trituberculatus]|uniref:Uncharacterized protein n=1 Tax=Portunus trituberculatus TaxID=210409 RepID=A0A5B7IUT6_PORTR|nr:hypothetical protein [Portunus trituberculatus]
MHNYARLTPWIMLGSAWLRVHFGHLQYLAFWLFLAARPPALVFDASMLVSHPPSS